MVINIEPITDIAAISINRDRLLISTGSDDRWDEFFAVLMRSEIIGAIRGYCRQLIRVEVRADQVIRGGLASRIRRIGRIWRDFGKWRIGFIQRAINFIR